MIYEHPFLKPKKSNIPKQKPKKRKKNVEDIDNDLLNEIHERLAEEEVLQKERRKQKKKNKRRNRISLSALTKEINGYGFEYRMSDFLKFTVLCLAGLVIAGILYKLHFVPNIIVLIIAAVMMIPGVISAQFKFVYEQQRFSEATDYMEQMIYSFMKKPKIIQALMDTQDMCEGHMKERIGRAIKYIQNGSYKTNLYLEAFGIIEEEYGCERMLSLHKFLAKVENQGGGYKESIMVLLDDIHSWTERVYTFQTNRKNIKGKILLVILMSLLVCGAMTYAVPAQFSITENTIYQWATTIALIAFMMVYVMVQSKLNSSWLGTIEVNHSQFFKAYKRVMCQTEKDLKKKSIPFVILGVAAAVYGYFALHNLMITVFGALVAIIMATQPKRSMKVARKTCIREFSKEFPGWLRDLSLQLQKENVQNAIVNSIPEAPTVLVPGLKQLQRDLEEDPVSIKPYSNFLSDFDLPEIQSAMKMLYSLNSIGKDEVVAQMNGLIIRNQAMLDAAERLKDEDSTALAGMLVAVPMAIVTLKMLVDMILLIVSFFSMMQI